MFAVDAWCAKASTSAFAGRFGCDLPQTRSVSFFLLKPLDGAYHRFAWATSRAFSTPFRRASRGLPRNCFHWSMMNCAGSRPGTWPAKRPAKPCSPPPWCTKPGCALPATAEPQWNSRRHFFCAAAEAMRRILVENARRKLRLKRGGNLERVDVDEVEIPAPMPDEDLLAMNDALDRLAELEPRAAEVVKLCFYVGLTQAQAAEHLGVSVATAERLWAFARAWLFQEIEKSRTPPV